MASIFASGIKNGVAKVPARTALIVLALALPLSVFGTMGPLYSSFQDKVQQYANFTGGYILIWPKHTLFPAHQLEQVRQVSHVTHVFGILEGDIGLPIKGALEEAQKSCGNPFVGRSNATKLQLVLQIIAFNMSAAAHLLVPYQLISGRYPLPDEMEIAINQVALPCLGISLGSEVSGLDAHYGMPPLNASGVP